jgi:hypothetical protein
MGFIKGDRSCVGTGTGHEKGRLMVNDLKVPVQWMAVVV